jgi:hypothetical protein
VIIDNQKSLLERLANNIKSLSQKFGANLLSKPVLPENGPQKKPLRRIRKKIVDLKTKKIASSKIQKLGLLIKK